ncbi:MAG: hypothetical protein ACREBR_01970, partial [bacterium]
MRIAFLILQQPQNESVNVKWKTQRDTKTYKNARFRVRQTVPADSTEPDTTQILLGEVSMSENNSDSESDSEWDDQSIPELIQNRNAWAEDESDNENDDFVVPSASNLNDNMLSSVTQIQCDWDKMLPREIINAEDRQQRRVHTNNDAYCIIDSGADVTSLGANWFITHRDEHSNYAISGPESLHQTPVQMDKVTGITKVNSTNGPILLRAHQASASTLGTPPEIETLINPAQLRHKGIKVYDLAHIFDGSQCIIIKQNYDKDIIIPLQYNGNYILHHTHPT